MHIDLSAPVLDVFSCQGNCLDLSGPDHSHNRSRPGTVGIANAGNCYDPSMTLSSEDRLRDLSVILGRHSGSPATATRVVPENCREWVSK